MPVLTTHNLTVGYNVKGTQLPVLSNLNLSLNVGELVCLLGANGKGKSTLLRTLAGTQKPLEGEVFIAGESLAEMSKKRLAMSLSIVYTDRTLTGALTVRELVGLGRQPHTGFLGRMSSTDNQVVQASMQAAGIAHKADALMAQLSDGERQKAMIAKALSQDTPVIFLDEPTAFLDVASKLDTMRLLHDLARSEKKAVLLSSHDVSQSLSLADRLWVIDSDGKMATGATEDVVLSGALSSLFPGENIVFDKLTGVFQNVIGSEVSVALLSGDAVMRHWCENALHRNGIALCENSEIKITPVAADCLRMSVSGEETEYGSISEVVSAIAELTCQNGSTS